ncbi:TIR domain-containing protein [Escherichia coli]|uniref:TIR domain-containing protein n=1 Tax=Escherichia coli TaxID=562 RepID=UPI001FA97200|nr:nucleotide-binding protein [Escherichia coli]MCI5461760.1 hypothetical protein [Escherichia coli]
MSNLDYLMNDFDRVNYLVNLLTTRATGGSPDNNEYTILRSQLLQNPTILQYIPPFVRQNRNLDSFWSFIQPKFGTYAERRSFISEQFTPLLDYLEFGESSQQNTTSKQSDTITNGTANIVMRNKRKVFIVHGRNNEAKQEVSRFITDLGLEPIILHEQASSGMTIIEKIERYSNDADFALVLYTACDLGRSIDEPNPPHNRARQNVVFEHGYLMAKLGRENVCALVKDNIETPNDISGVVYVSLDPHGAWKMSVSKELRACGYTIKSIF